MDANSVPDEEVDQAAPAVGPLSAPRRRQIHQVPRPDESDKADIWEDDFWFPKKGPRALPRVSDNHTAAVFQIYDGDTDIEEEEADGAHLQVGRQRSVQGAAHAGAVAA